MHDDQQIHQIEFRWIGDGFQPIAWSGLSREAMKTWSDRLQPIARPARADENAPGVPSSSVVYQEFPGEKAAVIQRFWMPEADLIEVTDLRRALVARAFVGSKEAVGPIVALTICLRELQSNAGPAPGFVQSGTQLPTVGATALGPTAAWVIGHLDRQARGDANLATLTAAALRHPELPISVILPERMSSQDPSAGIHAAMLLGLWQTAGILLTDSHRRSPFRWSFSFSTYEPQAEHTASRQLPHVVFRSPRLKTGGPPAMQREESIVRLFDPAGSNQPDDEFTDHAERLVVAYRDLGFQELSHRLRPVRDLDDLHDRLTRLPRHLPAFFQRPSPTTGSVTEYPPVGNILDTSAVQEQAPASAASDFHDRTTPMSKPRAEMARPPAHACHSSDHPVPSPAKRHPNVTDAPTADMAQQPGPITGHTAKSASTGVPRAPEDPLPLATGSRPHPAIRSRDGTLADLFHRLAQTSDRSEFARGLRQIEDLVRQQSPPLEGLAEARTALAEEGWLERSLTDHAPRAVEDWLREMLKLIVVPELTDPAVRAQLADWAQDPKTPSAVIMALDAVAHLCGEEAEYALQQELEPALCRRWRAEHGLYTVVRPPKQTSAEAPDPPHQPWRETTRPAWWHIPHRLVTPVVTSSLALLSIGLLVCIVVIVLAR